MNVLHNPRMLMVKRMKLEPTKLRFLLGCSPKVDNVLSLRAVKASGKPKSTAKPIATRASVAKGSEFACRRP